MFLSTVEIKNFRNLSHLRVEFSKLNVIVGRNNTGKTNLLKAIRHAVGPGGSRGEALWLERDDFYRESATDDTGPDHFGGCPRICSRVILEAAPCSQSSSSPTGTRNTPASFRTPNRRDKASLISPEAPIDRPA